ncbi:MAG: nitroreductase family protein [Acidimicrobiales bacterium]|nr:nitroreductase family protein [Acidimicrobiales bacterium]HRW38335.1 nitroreductase family protein [Aquihabitans sp.]
MELRDAVRGRRMVRAFADAPVAPELLDELIDLARRAPSAGNVAACRFLVLDEPDDVARYWDATLPAERRAGFRWPGLVAAPALVVVAVRPASYPERYAEPDKAATGLGEGQDRWAVPYWWVDAGAAAEHLLLGAVDAGLGACLFGLFDHEPAVADAFGVAEGWRLVATVALGWPAPDEPGRSAHRPRPPLDEVRRRGRW